MSKRMKRCPSCGNQMPAGLRICRKCQAKEKAEQVQRPEATAKPTQPEEVRPENTSKPTQPENVRQENNPKPTQPENVRQENNSKPTQPEKPRQENHSKPTQPEKPRQENNSKPTQPEKPRQENNSKPTQPEKPRQENHSKPTQPEKPRREERPKPSQAEDLHWEEQPKSARSEDIRREDRPKPMRPEEVRRNDAPRPVETARRPAAGKRRKNSTGIGQLVAVLTVIVAVIVVAVVLVVKMNQSTSTDTADEYNGVHILTQDGEDITPTSPPEPEEAEAEEEPAEEPAEETVTPSLDDAEEADTALPEEEPAAAEAEEETLDVTPADDTVYVAGSGVNLRTGPSTTYDVVATLSRGVELKRTGTVSGWSQVEYEGQTCYVSNSLVSTEKQDAAEATPIPSSFDVTAANDTVTVGTKANVRTGPDTTYESVGIVDVGTALQRTGTYGHWSQVVYNGREVFINNNMLENKGESAAATATATAVTITVTAQSGTLTVVSDAHVRSGPGTTYTILGTVKTGETLTVTGLTNTNWYQISYDGQTGYIAGNLVEKN